MVLTIDTSLVKKEDALKQLEEAYNSSSEKEKDTKTEESGGQFAAQKKARDIKEAYEQKAAATNDGRKAALFDPKKREEQVKRITF
jgi:hypothetical protein